MAVRMDDKQLAEIKRDLERYGHAITWPSAIVRALVAEVERLQRFEAMWEDCRQHRDNAERRARGLHETLQQVAKLVAPDEDDLL
jgi:hypothetical protein